MDVSTVDGATSKVINERVKATGALFLEVVIHISLISHCLSRGLEKGSYILHILYKGILTNLSSSSILIGSCFWVQKAGRRWAAHFSNCR